MPPYSDGNDGVRPCILDESRQVDKAIVMTTSSSRHLRRHHDPSERLPRRALLGGVLAIGAGTAGGAAFVAVRHDGADEAATALARALATGDFADAPVLDSRRRAVAKEHKVITDKLRKACPQPPEVTVEAVDQLQGDQRRIRLNWRWELPGGAGPWMYVTSTDLSHVDGKWCADVTPSSVVDGLLPGERLSATKDRPQPGRILDRRGTQILGPTPVHVLGLDKPAISADQIDGSARTLATHLRIDEEAFARKAAAYGPQAFVPAITLRETDLASYDIPGVLAVPGAVEREETQLRATTKNFAPGLLGTFREPTAEEVEKSSGTLKEGQVAGIGGVAEARSDALLGVGGIAVVAESASHQTRELHSVVAREGADVMTTLDADMQRIANELLTDAPAPSAIIALQPSTGDVLVSSVGPAAQQYPIGLVGQYPPGSTFKTITALSLLRTGDTPETILQCPATASVAGRSFKNADRMDPSLFGPMPLKDVIAHSCNTALLLQHDRVPATRIADAAGALGFGLGPSEALSWFSGSVDPQASGTEHAADMMGQGKVLASPLTMAIVMASVVAGGVVRPRVLADDDATAETPSAPLTSEEADALRGMLRGVVTYGGLRSTFGDIEGDAVFAKTGTAQWVKDGAVHLHAWVIVAQGDLAIAVFVEDGDYGSRTAAPIARRFLDAIHGK